MELDNEPPPDEWDDEDVHGLMSDQEFDDELELAAAGKWEDLGLHGGVIPGFEKTPISEFLNGSDA